MRSPYADINAAAIRAAFGAPHLSRDPRHDPSAPPSPASERARNARIAASLIAQTAFRLTIARRRDYTVCTGTGCPQPFHTAR